MRKNLIRELYNEGLGFHFSSEKTRDLVEERYFWTRSVIDIMIFVEGYRIC